MRLTTTELIERGEALARAHQAVRVEKADQKAAKERMKDTLDDLEGEVGRLARIVRDKAEDRAVTCTRVYDFAAGQVQVVREDTGEVVATRAMSEDERQIALPVHGVQ